MASSEFPYLHGISPEEHSRLAVLNRLLNEESLRALNLQGGEKILDVGCGLAQMARAMARLAGDGGRVVGVDYSAEQLDGARRQAAEAGEEGLVDLGHQRDRRMARVRVHVQRTGGFIAVGVKPLTQRRIYRVAPRQVEKIQ